MANRMFRQFMNTLRKYPVLIDCNFVVDSTNGNGLGIRTLKPVGSANGIASVYMHTSATPATGNPNPLAGYIVVNFQDDYFGYLGGFSGQVSPLSGTPLTATVNHTPYVIVSLGTATLAQWQAVGVPVGQVPAVGLAFVATATATIGGSAAVEVIATTTSGIDHIEVLGDPNLSLDPNGPQTQNQGQIILACVFEGAVTQPANGTVIGLTFYLSNSGASGLG
jgi:hypothetical protein